MRLKATGRRIAAVAVAMILPLLVFAAAPPPIIESRPMDLRGQAAQPGGAPPGSLEDRIARLERQAGSQVLVEMLSRLESLQQEVQELRGSVEVQDHKITGIEQRQRDLYLDIDRRMRQLESGAAIAQQQREQQVAVPGQTPGVAVAAPSGAAAVPAAGVVATAAAQDQDQDTERAAYQRAFDSLQAERYEESIASFRNFLARYPDGQYSANAQYWLGEAKYVTRQFSDAIGEFDKVLQHYPDSSKVPDAMLKLGFSYYELQDWNKANETLSRLVEQHPRSTARQLAENRLHRMRVEGR